MTAIAAVLKRANYSTHQLGKWDAGMSTPGHTPRGRGFDSSLGYFDHENDYYDFRPETPFNTTFERGPCPSTRQYKDLWDTDGPAAAAAAGAIAAGEYEEALLLERATRIIQSHDLGGGGGGNGIGGVPLFLYYAFHIAHTPLQVPAEWLAKFDFITDSDTRKAYHAMVAYMDHVVGNVTAQLRQRGMWNNTLIVSLFFRSCCVPQRAWITANRQLTPAPSCPPPPPTRAGELQRQRRAHLRRRWGQ
jgi:arylsulfatase I/J